MAHDSLSFIIYQEVLAAGDVRNGFVVIPEGQLYLADMGYPIYRRYRIILCSGANKMRLGYASERDIYTFLRFCGRCKPHHNPRQLFNHEHPQLRNSIKRTFQVAVIKRRSFLPSPVV